MIIHDVKQGTREWFEARLGIPTASKFKEVISRGEMRKTYMMQLLAERLLQRVTETRVTPDMQRGTELEPVARMAYCIQKEMNGEFEANPELIGLITDNGAGYSPDFFIGDKGCGEIKCPRAHNHLKWLVADKVPAEHIPQVNGAMLISGREWCDFVSYCPPLPLFVKRVFRDEKKLAEMQDRVDIFNAELDALQRRIGEMQ